MIPVALLGSEQHILNDTGQMVPSDTLPGHAFAKKVCIYW
jgi:hypothetical protein